MKVFGYKLELFPFQTPHILAKNFRVKYVPLFWEKKDSGVNMFKYSLWYPSNLTHLFMSSKQDNELVNKQFIAYMYKLLFFHILTLYKNKNRKFPVVNNSFFRTKPKYFHVHCVNFFITKIKKHFAQKRHTVFKLSIVIKV